jgi:hypothetical protein
MWGKKFHRYIAAFPAPTYNWAARRYELKEASHFYHEAHEEHEGTEKRSCCYDSSADCRHFGHECADSAGR